MIKLFARLTILLAKKREGVVKSIEFVGCKNAQFFATNYHNEKKVKTKLFGVLYFNWKVLGKNLKVSKKENNCRLRKQSHLLSIKRCFVWLFCLYLVSVSFGCWYKKGAAKKVYLIFFTCKLCKVCVQGEEFETYLKPVRREKQKKGVYRRDCFYWNDYGFRTRMQLKRFFFGMISA